MFPVHEFDNALGGAKFDSGASGVLVNTGKEYATADSGRPTLRRSGSRQHPTPIGDQEAALMATLFGPVLTQPLFEGQLPVYPPDRTATGRA